MKLGAAELELDTTDVEILNILQDNCKVPFAKIGEQVGLSAPSVMERIKKLEDHGVILGYRAVIDARRVGNDVTAFIGVSVGHPRRIGPFEEEIGRLPEVLECHHVTGQHTFLLKVKTQNTSTLENLIRAVRSIEGVERTETMVVLSTNVERTQVALPASSAPANRRMSRKARVESEGKEPKTIGGLS
ncbi:MAG: Lrp/AsnC family transcriptional regulator [Candidatus Binatia bacterium]|nr:Lrp/AsnC family transcriptional regulator [Candidatus Binatia bacterium]